MDLYRTGHCTTECFSKTCISRYPFASQQARDLNRRIFETLYHAALEASCEIAERDGPYETYKGSPASKGVCNCSCYRYLSSMKHNSHLISFV